VDLDQVKARVDELRCDCCALCVDACPYSALFVERQMPVGGGEAGKQRLAVLSARCKGCGACQATCPKGGINVTGFSSSELSAQVRAALQ
jgi:heterodisulfide reductase subunit A